MAQYIDFKPSDYFSTITYTGDGEATRAITGVGFQPDFLWCKVNAGRQHYLCNSVIGSTYNVDSDRNNAEVNDTTGITGFDADGFSIGSDTNGELNDSGTIQASWCWKMGTTSGLTGGTITPSGYSINTTACQGVYAYTGTGANATIAHGLGKVPTLIWVKCRSNSADWSVYNGTVGYNSGATTAAGYLDATLNDSNARTTSSTMWNNVDATDTTFTVGTETQTNNTAYTYIAYVFCDVPGYCTNGQYRGNGNADGPLIYTGFEPSFVIFKNRDSGGPSNYGWTMYQNTFGMDGAPSTSPGYNTILDSFYADQATGIATVEKMDFLANGFKLRGSGASSNQASSSFLYTAFAKNPIVGKNETPGTAR